MQPMPLSLDHIVIAVHDIDMAIADYRELGFTVLTGGLSANRTTERALIFFHDGTFLELLALKNAGSVSSGVDYRSLLGEGEGIVAFALRTTEISAEVLRLRAAGFNVGEPVTEEWHGRDGVVIQQKIALIDNAFTPFLVQAVTPHSSNSPVDPQYLTHANQAVGIRGIELVVRDMNEIWERYIRLFGFSPNYRGKNHRTIGGIILNELMIWASAIDRSDRFDNMFAGTVPQSEIDAADATLEPMHFENMRTNDERSRLKMKEFAEQERAMAAALEGRSEAIFSIHLIREADNANHFTLDRTHGVRFRQFTGVYPSRGADLLIGLEQVDWSTVNHAYGPANDVPELLRALTSDSAEVRSDAYRTLDGSIVHQGTIYSASVETIPFLVQMLFSPKIRDIDSLIYLLEDVVFGSSNMPELQPRAKALLTTVFPMYLNHVDHPNAAVRRTIAAQLALFTDETEVVELLAKHHVDNEPDEYTRATWLQTLSKLWTTTEPEMQFSADQTSYLVRIMRDAEQPETLHFHAACILAERDPLWIDEALEVFNRVMLLPRERLASFEPYGVSSIFFQIEEALRAFPTRIILWLLSQAQHPDWRVRQRVIDSLRSSADRGQPTDQMIFMLKRLLHDPSPDVRHSAVGFFYSKREAREVIEELREIAANDISLTVRTVARNTLSWIPP
jgi:catechol 2,3-dioxygenase-like lactoylglutathione lyase family enzyme/HEAT repeat protein